MEVAPPQAHQQRGCSLCIENYSVFLFVYRTSGVIVGQLEFLISLIRKSGTKSALLLRASIIAGALQGLLLYVMSSSIEELSQSGSVSLRNFLLFVASLAGLYLSLRTSMRISSAVARGLVTGLETRIVEKVSKTSYAHFISIEQGRIYDAITGGKDIINESAIMLPVFICSCTMLMCCLFFSAFISLAGLFAVLVVMGAGAMIFFHSDRRFIAALHEYRASVAPFQASLKDVILGFTELKMNEERRAAFFAQVIEPLAATVLDKRVVADGFRVQNTVMYGLLVYFPVGALLYVLPQTGLATLEQCVKIVAITLFGTIPLIGLLSFMPMAARASFIVEGLESFERSLDELRDSEIGMMEPAPPFTSLQIRNARYSYSAQNGVSPFIVTVDDFILNKGELVFLSGGNGSGKSTLMRLIAGLTPFHEGEVTLSGTPLAVLGGGVYRQCFSTLFPDFHLFGGTYGLKASPERVNMLLKRLALAGKVQVDEATGQFSTLTLSSGQRKRLALACTLLEDRPVLLLDEVAADFDHHFREFFYRELLPELKAEGRTMLVVSHDDRYFDVADRVLVMRYGVFDQGNAGGMR